MAHGGHLKSQLVVAFAILAVGMPAAGAAQAIRTLNDLPKPVADVFATACAADNWISGKRELAGSSTSTFEDGTKAYLLVCGDAASTVPFTAIVLSTAGVAREAKLNWRLGRKSLENAGLSNARFGAPGTGTIVSRTHESATCEPTYTHAWDGKAFQLKRVNRRGCRTGE